jgi:hypothetical protein
MLVFQRGLLMSNSRLSDLNVEDPIIRNAMYRDLMASDKSDWINREIAVDEELRPDIASYRIYGTIECRWVVSLVAGVTDELEPLPVGISLSYPPANVVRKSIKKFGG